MKIGIFGGTFDPPHLSHTLACYYVLETSDIEKIYVIPCYRHPFGKTMEPFKHRLEMCKLAMARLYPGIEVLDIEGKRGGVSYTIDTIKDIQKQCPDDELFLIVGSDILKETENWKDFDEVEKLATLHPIPRLINSTENPDVDFFLPDISSTMVREKLHNGESVDKYLARQVIEYIKQQFLYK
jgi:nicotinate-nucleotide adenylyltransferase